MESSLDVLLRYAENGNPAVFRDIGYFYAKGLCINQDYEKAFEWTAKAAEKGDAKAQCNLGLCYKNAQGVKQDHAMALKWFKKAAAQNNATALFYVGKYYLKGIATETDYELAIKYITQAAEQGYQAAQRFLGTCYYEGQGVEQDYAKAFEWHSKAAENGNVASIFATAYMYYNGLGVEKDLHKAYSMMFDAGRRGYTEAKYYTGLLITKEAKPDYERAELWLTAAAEEGFEEAKTLLEELITQELISPQKTIQDPVFGELSIFKQLAFELIEMPVVNSENGYESSWYEKDTDAVWRTKATTDFYNEEKMLEILLETNGTDVITTAQREAYTEYKKKEKIFFNAMQVKAKDTFRGANGKDDYEVVPQSLYIDRDGNYGWICEKAWDGEQIAVILSDGDVKLADTDILYKYKEVIADKTKTRWKVSDNIYVSVFGVLTSLKVDRAESFLYDDDLLSSKEVELLLWTRDVLESDALVPYVTDYCNMIYSRRSYKRLEKTDLPHEVEFKKITIDQRAKSEVEDWTDAYITGDCVCSQNEGIKIEFKDKCLLNIGTNEPGIYE